RQYVPLGGWADRLCHFGVYRAGRSRGHFPRGLRSLRNHLSQTGRICRVGWMKEVDVSSRFKGAAVHSRLGSGFFDPVQPADFPQAILRYRNRRWAERMGLEGLTDAQWIAHFARFEPLPGSFEKPLALRYHGHQFQSYNPDLGDGRGFLFALGFDLVDGTLRDFGTKGSGTTPWSRGGDGRLTLKGGVREVLATTMLEALGVETSKSFSLIET